MTFAFPLGDRLDLRQVDYSADAALAGVAVPHAVLGLDVADGDFAVKARRATPCRSTARLRWRQSVPVTVGATLSLADNQPVRLKATIEARLDGNGRRALGLDYGQDMMSGPVGVAVAYQMTQGASRPRRRCGSTSHDSGARDPAARLDQIGRQAMPRPRKQLTLLGRYPNHGAGGTWSFPAAPSKP